MTFRRITLILLMGAVLWGLASINAVWAIQGQDSTRQTLFTRTPSHVPTNVPPPKPEKDTPTPAPSAVPGTAVPGATLVPTVGVGTPSPGVALAPGQTPQVLPPTGARLVAPLAIVGVGGLLISAGWFARRKTVR